MSFIAKNPLSMPKIETNPSTPSGTRGLFAKNDGWYDIADNGDIVKICSNDDMVKSLKEVESYIDEKIAKFDFIKIISELPETGEENYIYLIPNNSDETKNIYDEYIWTNLDWEHLGSKQMDIDLSDYVKQEDGKGLSSNDFTNENKQQIQDNTNNISKIVNGQTEVGIASEAWEAEKAYQDEDGNNIADTYEKKVDIQTNTTDNTLLFNFSETHNQERRMLETLYQIEFCINNDVYTEDYLSGLSFHSGDTTPTSAVYTNSPILNWYGTDCSSSSYVDDEGVTRYVSIFQPSPDTYYDIVFEFKGTHFLGRVTGYKLASSNVPID